MHYNIHNISFITARLFALIQGLKFHYRGSVN